MRNMLPQPLRGESSKQNMERIEREISQSIVHAAIALPNATKTFLDYNAIANQGLHIKTAARFAGIPESAERGQLGVRDYPVILNGKRKPVVFK